MIGRAKRGLRDISLLAGALALLAAAAPPARAQTAVNRDDIIAQLNRFETAADIDVAALRQQVLERSRSRSKTEPPPQKRPPIAPELTKLPAFNVDIQFDVDTPIILPASYQTIGRLADAMVHSSLQPYSFLIVGHIDATGRRENNALLSQRRADAVRDVLINTFKIAAKRLQSVGLGEEQLLDPAHPNAPVNNQLQILTVSKAPEQSEQPAKPTAPSSRIAVKKADQKKIDNFCSADCGTRFGFLCVAGPPPVDPKRRFILSRVSNSHYQAHHVPDHFRFQSLKGLWFRLQGAEQHQSRH